VAEADISGNRVDEKADGMTTYTCELRSWDVTGETRIEVAVDPSQLLGARGLFGAALLVNYTVSIAGPYASGAALLTLEGWLLWHNEQPMIPGIRIPSQVSGASQAQLLIPITPEQIEAIENARAGDAVHINLSLAGTARLLNPQVRVMTNTQRLQGDFEEVFAPRPEVHEVRQQNGAQRIRIEREQWLTILEALGVGKRRLVELPVPALPHHGSDWETCLQHLETALLHHRRGEYEQALQQCRKVIEGVATVLGAVWRVPQRAGQSFESWTKELNDRLAKAWPSEREAPKMLSALLAAGWTWTSPAAHYGVDMPVREESAFGLSVATDVLMFASQLIAAHPPNASSSAGTSA
jgi:hypothetical protein